MRVNEELTVRDNEFRLRLIAFKLYTVSSKSLMQSVVLLKYHTVTEKSEERWESDTGHKALCPVSLARFRAFVLLDRGWGLTS